jgi:hypothetical protein
MLFLFPAWRWWDCVPTYGGGGAPFHLSASA